jgi:hypothetical protein
MGLSIAEYPVYKNAATVVAYTNIRDIQENKENNKFILSGFARFTTSDVFVDAIHIRLTSDTVFSNSWSCLYTELKRVLTEKSIVHVDT